MAGGGDGLDAALRTLAIAEVVVSSPAIAPERLAQLRDICEPHGVTVVRAVLRFE